MYKRQDAILTDADAVGEGDEVNVGYTGEMSDDVTKATSVEIMTSAAEVAREEEADTEDLVCLLYTSSLQKFHSSYSRAEYMLNTGSIMDKTIVPTMPAITKIIHGSINVTSLCADCSAAFP